MKNFYQTTDSYTFLASGTTELSKYDKLWFQIHNAKTFEDLPFEQEIYDSNQAKEITSDQALNLFRTNKTKVMEIYREIHTSGRI